MFPKFLSERFDLDLWPSEATEVENIFTIWKPIHDFLSNFYLHFLSISYRFLNIRLQSFQGWTLTFRGHLRSKIFSLFESPYVTSYLTSIDTFSLSHTVFEIFDFKVFRVRPWPLEVTWGKKIFFTIRKPIHDLLSNLHWHFLSISYRFLRYSTLKFALYQRYINVQITSDCRLGVSREVLLKIFFWVGWQKWLKKRVEKTCCFFLLPLPPPPPFPSNKAGWAYRSKLLRDKIR